MVHHVDVVAEVAQQHVGEGGFRPGVLGGVHGMPLAGDGGVHGAGEGLHDHRLNGAGGGVVFADPRREGDRDETGHDLGGAGVVEHLCRRVRTRIRVRAEEDLALVFGVGDYGVAGAGGKGGGGPGVVGFTEHVGEEPAVAGEVLVGAFACG